MPSFPTFLSWAPWALASLSFSLLPGNTKLGSYPRAFALLFPLPGTYIPQISNLVVFFLSFRTLLKCRLLKDTFSDLPV